MGLLKSALQKSATQIQAAQIGARRLGWGLGSGPSAKSLYHYLPVHPQLPPQLPLPSVGYRAHPISMAASVLESWIRLGPETLNVGVPGFSLPPLLTPFVPQLHLQ